jgi:RHS repeat-associated protein
VTDWRGRVTEYEYDGASRLGRASLPDGSAVSYAYDGAGRLVAITDAASDGSVVLEAQLTLNEAGLLTGVTAQLPLESVTSYTEADFAVDGANQIVSLNGCVDCFVYDQDGNLIRGLIKGIMTDLAYDELGQLVQIGQDSYGYDAEGLRIQSVLQGVTRRYVVDPNAQFSRVLEEHDASGQIVARYVYGVGLISREDAVTRQAHIFHFDHRGNTVALTDEGENVTDRYAYRPYGGLTGQVGSTPNPFRFDGRDGVMDDGNGLYSLRSRYYSPELMRFIQRDSLYRGTLLETQSLNRYAYVQGMPVFAVDPEGDFVHILIGAAAGLVVNVAVEVVKDAISGEWDPWDYVAAGIGGAIGGGLAAAGSGPAGWAAGGAAGAFLQEGTAQTYNMIRGRQEWLHYDPGALAIAAATGAAAGSFGKEFGRAVYSTVNVRPLIKAAGFAAREALGSVYCSNVPDWPGCPSPEPLGDGK